MILSALTYAATLLLPPAAGRQQQQTAWRCLVSGGDKLPPSIGDSSPTAQPTEDIAAGIISLVGVLLHLSSLASRPGAMVTRGAGSADEAEDASLFAHHQPRQAECDVPYR